VARAWHRELDEAGFSLVELLVIVVLGILAAISIST
jgi:Tfp pilus assembly protein FimT